MLRVHTTNSALVYYAFFYIAIQTLKKKSPSKTNNTLVIPWSSGQLLVIPKKLLTLGINKPPVVRFTC